MSAFAKFAERKKAEEKARKEQAEREQAEREQSEREQAEEQEAKLEELDGLVLEQEYGFDDGNGYVNEDGGEDEGEDGGDDAEDEVNEDGEAEDGEAEDGEGDEGRLVNEFGAFGAGGRSGGRSFQFAENEVEQFWNNMEQFLLNQYDNTSSLVKENFSQLVKKYPHPRTLSPVLCNLIHIFYSNKSKKYVWNISEYNKYKQQHNREFPNVQKHDKYYPFPSQLHFLRYIHLFNTFAI